MKNTLMATLVLTAMVSGCYKDGTDSDVVFDTSSKTNSKVRYLCVGMESSKRFGACPGCASDAATLQMMLSRLGYVGEVLISSQATKSEVVSRLYGGITNTDEDGLFIFCYSGHGGQEYLGGKEPDGAERQDEYLCLYDTYMKDDEIWEIISKCKGRVFLYFDACHSATMYRSVASELSVAKEGVAVALEANNLVKSSGFSFSPQGFAMAEAMSADGDKPRNSIRMLCWSGCQELEYSYGGSNGGVMTRAFSRNWKKGITYGELWPRIVSDVKKEQPTQNPSQTVIGGGFSGVEVFR